MLVFSLAICVRNAVKTMVVDRKKPKSTSSAIFGVETAVKSCELKRYADRVRTEPTRQISFELFFSLTNLFLTFAVFACFVTTRVNRRFRAKNTRDSAQGYIQCMKCIGNPVVRTDGRTDVRHYKISWLDRLPNFLSNGAPLTR